MNRLLLSRMAIAVLAVMALFVCAGRAAATDISGNISTTVTITEDSQLVDDVTCAVPLTVSGANPCIAFGTDHIHLSLNGHTITGPVDAPTNPTSCSFPADSMFGVGILASGRTDVKLEGPGVVQKFQRWGILLLSSDHVTVRNVTATRNCWSGMQTISTSDSQFEEDIWVNNASGSHGAACGGICLVNSNNNRMRKSTFYGNGSLDYANGNVDFGVGFEGSSSVNRVEENDIGGNTNGVEFFNTSSDNLVRRNIIVGNPAAQVIKSFTASNQRGADIAFRPSFTGANNILEDNFCLTYLQGGGPATAPCPNVITEGVEEAANRLTGPAENPPGPSRAKTAERGAPIFSLVLVILAAAFGRLALG